jgi:hypothetical protein
MFVVVAFLAELYIFINEKHENIFPKINLRALIYSVVINLLKFLHLHLTQPRIEWVEEGPLPGDKETGT